VKGWHVAVTDRVAAFLDQSSAVMAGNGFENGNIPAWNGAEDSWNTYLEDVEWFFYSTETKSRHLVASRLARKLQGSARNALKGLRAREFAGVAGITKLLRILQSRIGDLPVPDLAHKLDEFIFKLRRKPGESMNEWGLRSIETYRKLTIALDRVKGKESDIGTFEEPENPDKQQSQKFPWPLEWENQGNWWEEAGWDEDVDDDERSESGRSEKSASGRKGKMGHRSTSKSSDGDSDSSSSKSSRSKTGVKKTSSQKGEEDTFKDEDGFLPAEVRGWLLLRNAGLTYSERATVIASTQGNLEFMVIFRALRQQYPPRDLGKIDEQRGRKGRGKGGINMLDESDGDGDGEWGEFEDDETSGGISFVDEDVEGDEEFEALQAEEFEALATVGTAQRTLVQARKAIQQAKLNRGFHPRKPLPQGFRKGGKGGGKGGKTGKYHSSSSSSNHTSSSHGGPCFICGGTHGYRECPDRNGPKVGSSKFVGTVFSIERVDEEPTPDNDAMESADSAPVDTSTSSSSSTEAPSETKTEAPTADRVDMTVSTEAPPAEAVEQPIIPAKTESVPDETPKVATAQAEPVAEAPVKKVTEHLKETSKAKGATLAPRMVPPSGAPKAKAKAATATGSGTCIPEAKGEPLVKAAVPKTLAPPLKKSDFLETDEENVEEEEEGEEEDRAEDSPARDATGEPYIMIDLQVPKGENIQFKATTWTTGRQILAAIRSKMCLMTGEYAIGLKISKKVMNLDQTLHSLGIQSLRTEKGGGPYRFELMIGRGNTEDKDSLYSNLDHEGHLWSEPPFPPGLVLAYAEGQLGREPDQMYFTGNAYRKRKEEQKAAEAAAAPKKLAKTMPAQPAKPPQWTAERWIGWTQDEKGKWHPPKEQDRSRSVASRHPASSSKGEDRSQSAPKRRHARRSSSESSSSSSHRQKRKVRARSRTPKARSKKDAKRSRRSPERSRTEQRKSTTKEPVEREEHLEILICEVSGKATKRIIPARKRVADLIGSMASPPNIPLRFLFNNYLLKGSDISRDLKDISLAYPTSAPSVQLHIFSAVSAKEVTNPSFAGTVMRVDDEEDDAVTCSQGEEIPEGVLPTANMFRAESLENTNDGQFIGTCWLDDAELLQLSSENLHRAIIDSGASDSVASPEALAALSTSIRAVNPKAKIVVDRAAGKKVKFRLANGATCSACSLVTIETAFGMMSLYCLDTEAPSPILLSVKALKKLSAAIDFSTDTLACKGVDGEGKAFAIEKKLSCNAKGHLLLDLSSLE
jgi:hypothetical protein